MPRTVSTWRGRFAPEGLAGSADKARPGPKPKYGPDTARRWNGLLRRICASDRAVAGGRTRDVHEQQVWRVLRERKIDLSGRKSWCESNDPESVAGRRRSSGSIWRRPRTRSAFARTRSPRSRLWSGHPSMDLLPIDVSDLPIPWPLGVRRDGDADWRGDRYAAATRSTGREVLSHLGSRFHRIYYAI